MAKKIKYALNNEEFYRTFLAGKKPEEGRKFISGGKTHDGVWLMDHNWHFARALRPRAGQIILSTNRYSSYRRARKYLDMYAPKKTSIIEMSMVHDPEKVVEREEFANQLFSELGRWARNDGKISHTEACLMYNQILADIGYSQYASIPTTEE